MTLEPGTRLGPYEIVELRGKGGMGEVYRARDTRLDRDVAVKVLPAELSEDETYRKRLEREAKTISRLQHPNVCTLHDIGSEGATQYLVMEYLEGETLEARLANGPLAVDDVLRIGGEIAEGPPPSVALTPSLTMGRALVQTAPDLPTAARVRPLTEQCWFGSTNLS